MSGPVDYIGSKRVSIRRDSSETIRISRLNADVSVVLDRQEWLELVALIMVIKAATDFLEDWIS